MSKSKIIVLLLILSISLFLMPACAESAASVSGVNSSSGNNNTEAIEDDVTINWEDAIDHIGETTTVVGRVEGSKYAYDTNGEPTFLDIGADYPDPDRFTVLIWGSDRSNFSHEPESYYLGKTVAVYGEIEYYKGGAEIIINSESDIKVLD